ncbi:unnamed protein product [Phytophthora lilii]|uniref:Unnamed protein product n=1 Tax=Phytophthora lilii TaxID=2077276 RepID=A0A9W6TPE6_9STRA|nr:unnamed protein product [Phytophthora lilii]
MPAANALSVADAMPWREHASRQDAPPRPFPTRLDQPRMCRIHSPKWTTHSRPKLDRTVIPFSSRSKPSRRGQMRSVSLFLSWAAAVAAAEQVLVVGRGPGALWHESASDAALSAAAMADLALDSLGLATGRVDARAAARSPLQADVFAHSEAFALLLLDGAALPAVDAALGGADAFHRLLPARAVDAKVPAAVAQQFGARFPQAAHCAGNVALCASVRADSPRVSAELLQQVLQGNAFLDAASEQDVAFARELAQVMQLAADVLKQQGKALYVLGLSTLQGDKQRAAQQAAATAAAEFLAQMLKSGKVVGAQVMTGKLPTALQQTAALSRRARNLVTKLSSDEDDEEEEEEEDLEAESGSVWEDDDNATTTTTNATVTGAVSMPDIAEYQIILWTSALLGAMLLMSVLAMANMDVGRDSLLYAKFIADVNGRKTN